MKRKFEYNSLNIEGGKWGGRRGLNPQPLEPQSSALPLSYAHRSLLARLKGFEPLAYCLEGSCSIRLSYRRSSGKRTGALQSVPGKFTVIFLTRE